MIVRVWPAGTISENTVRPVASLTSARDDLRNVSTMVTVPEAAADPAGDVGEAAPGKGVDSGLENGLVSGVVLGGAGGGGAVLAAVVVGARVAGVAAGGAVGDVGGAAAEGVATVGRGAAGGVDVVVDAPIAAEDGAGVEEGGASGSERLVAGAGAVLPMAGDPDAGAPEGEVGWPVAGVDETGDANGVVSAAGTGGGLACPMTVFVSDSVAGAVAAWRLSERPRVNSYATPDAITTTNATGIAQRAQPGLILSSVGRSPIVGAVGCSTGECSASVSLADSPAST